MNNLLFFAGSSKECVCMLYRKFKEVKLATCGCAGSNDAGPADATTLLLLRNSICVIRTWKFMNAAAVAMATQMADIFPARRVFILDSCYPGFRRELGTACIFLRRSSSLFCAALYYVLASHGTILHCLARHPTRRLSSAAPMTPARHHRALRRSTRARTHGAVSAS